jgi:hypothetical protein
MLSLGMNELPVGMRRAIQLHELDERSSEDTARIMGISVGALKGRMFHGRKQLRERLEHIVEPAWTSAKKTPRTMGNITQDMSHKIGFPATRVVEAGAKGGPYGDVSVCRRIGDFGVSMFQRSGRFYRPEASSLNRVRDDGISSGATGYRAKRV